MVLRVALLLLPLLLSGPRAARAWFAADDHEAYHAAAAARATSHAQRPRCGQDALGAGGPPPVPIAEQHYGADDAAAGDDGEGRGGGSSDEGAAGGRTLQTEAETYGSTPTGAFQWPLKQADARGLLAPIRIAVRYDVMDAGDVAATRTASASGATPQKRQCTLVNDVIYVQNAAGNAEVTMTCLEDSVVVTGNARYAAIQTRTQAAATYFSSALRLRPMKSALSTSAAVQTSFGLSAPITVQADLMIIVTARPSPNIGIAGFAVCMQRDQWNRCTVGWFNWVPKLINTTAATFDSVIESEMHTALHEMVHVLGGLNPVVAVQGTPSVSSMFISWAGGAPAPLPPSAVMVTENFDRAFPTSGRTITKIASPLVLNLTREYFGCPNATGMPLEDIPLGVGAHWEARVSGGELMSYGTGASQIVVSAFTLAYLEDTGQYAVNASAGGIVFPSLGFPNKDPGIVGSALYSAAAAAAAPSAAPPSLPLYGRGAGCGFLDGAPTRAWPAAYTCDKHNSYGCTPDNRMSATCIIKGDINTEAAVSSRFVDAATGETRNTATNAQAPGVPLAFQTWATPAAAQAASGLASSTQSTTGGYSNAMDWVPVPVGYWSCNAATQTSNVGAGADGSGAGLSSFTSLFGVGTDMAAYAGQARCDTCRCMRSTLLPLTQSVTLETSKTYGLCYITNCFSSTYLQVGIYSGVGATSIAWYRCPAAGGNIYIVGYTGFITCPPAAEFCALENVSALLYSETSFLWVMIVWGSVAGVATLLCLGCTCGLTRDALQGACKRCCGALQFETEYVEEEVVSPTTGKSTRVLRVLSTRELLSAPALLKPPPPPTPDAPRNRLPPSRASWALWTISLITGAAGLAMTAWCINLIVVSKNYENLIPLLGVSVAVAFLSLAGWCASRKRAERGPSCWLTTYIGVILFVTAMMVWVIAYYFSRPDWTSFVSANLAILTPLLADSCKEGATTAAREASIAACFARNSGGVAALACAVLAVLLAAGSAAAVLVHITTFTALSLTVLTWGTGTAGVLLAAAGAYLLAVVGGSGFATLTGCMLGAGLFLIVAAAVGLVGVFRKSLTFLLAYLACLALACVFFAGLTWLFFAQFANISAYVAGLTEAQVAAVFNALGVSASKDVLISALSTGLLQLGITAALLLFIYILLVGATLAYLYFTRDDKAQRTRASAANSTATGLQRATAADAGAAAARAKLKLRSSTSVSRRVLSAAVVRPFGAPGASEDDDGWVQRPRHPSATARGHDGDASSNAFAVALAASNSGSTRSMASGSARNFSAAAFHSATHIDAGDGGDGRGGDDGDSGGDDGGGGGGGGGDGGGVLQPLSPPPGLPLPAFAVPLDDDDLPPAFSNNAVVI